MSEVMSHGTSQDNWDLVSRKLVTLACSAHLTAASSPAGDQGYWLGQRAAYAEAAGLLIHPTVDDLAFATGKRIEAALDQGHTELDDLTFLAWGANRQGEQAPKTTAGSLAWAGPLAFGTSHPGAPGIDRDFGDHRGARHDQRVSFRHAPGATSGLLYAYDPLWNEYAVLAAAVTQETVAHTLSQAAAAHTDHTVEELAFLVARNRIRSRDHPNSRPVLRSVPRREIEL